MENKHNPFYEMMKDNPLHDYMAEVTVTWQEYYKHLATNNATLMQRLTNLTMNCMKDNNNNKDADQNTKKSSSSSTSNSSASSL